MTFKLIFTLKLRDPIRMILEKREKSSLVSESNDEIYNKLLDEMVECKKVKWEKSSIKKKVHNVSVNFSIILP